MLKAFSKKRIEVKSMIDDSYDLKKMKLLYKHLKKDDVNQLKIEEELKRAAKSSNSRIVLTDCRKLAEGMNGE